MTANAFTEFFFDVIKNQIPADASVGISKYWQAFGAKPELFLTDAQIAEQGLTGIEVAAVFGQKCYHRFAFREFVVAHAPRPVARSIIQHELIHCFLQKDDTPIKQLVRRVFLRPEIRPLSPITKMIKETQEKIRRLAVYNADEHLVAMTNVTWGGNDELARDWTNQYLAENKA